MVVEALMAVVTNCTVPLIWMTNQSDYPLRIGASGFLVTHHGRFYVVTASHNLRNCNFEDLCVGFTENRKKSLPIGGLVSLQSRDKADSEINDLALLLVDKQLADPQLMASLKWLDLTHSQDRAVAPSDILIYAGFPTCRQSIDYELQAISMQPVIGTASDCHPTESQQVYRASIGRKVALEASLTSSEPLAGLSGGPVFVIGEGLTRHLAGMMIRGSQASGTIRFLGSRLIKSALRRLLAAEGSTCDMC